MTTFDAVDLFSGPRGWGVAARRLGQRSVGFELDAAAAATSKAAGFATIRCDVAEYPAEALSAATGLPLARPALEEAAA